MVYTSTKYLFLLNINTNLVANYKRKRFKYLVRTNISDEKYSCVEILLQIYFFQSVLVELVSRNHLGKDS